MNFNLLFSAVSALSFTIEFTVDKEESQDYFLFGGNNNSAHLFRENTTLLLHLSRRNGETYSIYNCEVDDGKFEFSWDGFTVDGKKMNLRRANGNIRHLDFEHFTFLSPIVEVLHPECSDKEEVYSCNEGVNYWYFVIIILVVGIVFDSKTTVVNLLRRLFIKSQALDSEDDYVSMEFDSIRQQEIKKESHV